MTERSQRICVLIVVLMAYTVAMLGFGYASFQANEQHLVYALDDAYIHMAMARNIAEHGVFGITPFEFSASSSSPLWTSLVAALYLAFGVSNWLPLLMNYLCGAGAILLIWKFGVDAGIRDWKLGLPIAAIIIFTPFVSMAFTGMEHLFHLVAELAMLYFLWRLLSTDHHMGRRDVLLFGVSIIFAVATRYESLFLVAAATIVLAARRNWIAVGVALLAALIPVFGYGAFAVANGQHLLPNTLLLKGNVPELNSLTGILGAVGGDGLQELLWSTHQYILVTLLVVVFWRNYAIGRWLEGRSLLIIVVLITTVLQLQFGGTGRFYRYDAYLVGISLMVLSIQFGGRSGSRLLPDIGQKLWMSRACLWVTLFLVLAPLAKRSAMAHSEMIPATSNIYQQQYQMGQFLNRFYDGEAVAANDVGAINYFARIRCLDLWGLGSQEIAQLKRRRAYSTDAIREMAQKRDVRVAILYSSWFKGEFSLPEEWVVVGKWTIPKKVVCASVTVDFLATDTSGARKLLANLRSFAAELPPGVVWEEVYEDEPIEP